MKYFVVVTLILCNLSWAAEQAKIQLPIKEINKFQQSEEGNKVTISFFFTFENGKTGRCAKYLDCNERDLSKQYSYTQEGVFIADDPQESWYQLFHAYDAFHGIKKTWHKK